jgi:hypothetical protein
MTIPNTLAALPKSQYATALSLVSGKELDFGVLFAPPIELLRAPSGDDVAFAVGL